MPGVCRGLLAVGAHKVQVGAPVVALPGVVHLLGGPHQQGGAGVVPLHRHRLGLEERLRRRRHPWVRDPEDLSLSYVDVIQGIWSQPSLGQPSLTAHFIS